MSNRGKKLAFTTATIAAIATVGSNVNAEEVTTPVAPSEPVAEATTETKTTTVSDGQVLDAQDKVSDAKADKQAKDTALTEAEAKRDAKAEEKAAAQAEEKALTEKVEAAKEATPEKVADLENTAPEKTADQEAQSQAVNNAKTEQTAKQTDVENKANALEAAKANQTAAADKVKAAEDALSGTAVKSAQDAKDAADKKVKDATATKDAADKELADSKKADQTRADSIASQKTIVAQDTTNKNNAIATEKAKNAEKEKLANDLTVAKKSLADKADFQNKHLDVMLDPNLDIYSLEGKKDFVRSLVAYNIVLEGIWFYSGFMVGMSFRQRNLLRNVGSLLDWITRDENLHLTFGINLLLTILDENPELQTQEFAEEIRGLILQAVELEKAYNKDMLPKGILGLNADYVNQYVMHMTDRRLQELGFEPEYNVPNPAKWMAAANDTLELVNFFESTNTSYEVNTTK